MVRSSPFSDISSPFFLYAPFPFLVGSSVTFPRPATVIIRPDMLFVRMSVYGERVFCGIFLNFMRFERILLSCQPDALMCYFDVLSNAVKTGRSGIPGHSMIADYMCFFCVQLISVSSSSIGDTNRGSGTKPCLQKALECHFVHTNQILRPQAAARVCFESRMRTVWRQRHTPQRQICANEQHSYLLQK